MILVRILLGILFLFSGVSKLFSMESFELYIFSFGLAAFDWSALAARIVIIVELVLGLCFIAGIYRKQTYFFSMLLMLLFSVFLLWRVAQGDERSCHCMGEVVDMNPAESLLKNLGIMALITVLCLPSRKKIGSRFQALASRYQSAVLGGVAVVSSVVVFAVVPPDLIRRIGRTSDDIVPSRLAPLVDSLDLDKGRKVLCLYSVTCEHCQHCASKMAGIVSRHDIDSTDMYAIFMEVADKQDYLVRNFYDTYGAGIHLPYTSLSPYVFLPLTNGSMPLVLLLEDGKMVKELDYISVSEREIVNFLK